MREFWKVLPLLNVKVPVVPVSQACEMEKLATLERVIKEEVPERNELVWGAVVCP